MERLTQRYRSWSSRPASKSWKEASSRQWLVCWIIPAEIMPPFCLYKPNRYSHLKTGLKLKFYWLKMIQVNSILIQILIEESYWFCPIVSKTISVLIRNIATITCQIICISIHPVLRFTQLIRRLYYLFQLKAQGIIKSLPLQWRSLVLQGLIAHLL